MNKVYVGCDPGKSGGIALISGNIIETFRIPLIKDLIDLHGFAEIFKSIIDVYGKENLIVGIEDVHSIFGSSAAANFQFGRALGILEGMIVTHPLSYIMAQPKTWQKVSFLGVQKILKPSSTGKTMTVDTKAMALVAAKRLYPQADLIANTRARKEHDGIVDALLIAHYIKTTQNG